VNGIVLVVATILVLAFDSSFAGIFTLRSTGSITPQAVPCLVVCIALFAPETTALVVALALGILVDSSTGHGQLGGGVHLIGPHALGFVVTTLLILKVRNIVFRRRILTIVLFTTGAIFVIAAVQAFVLITRGFMPWNQATVGGGLGEFAKLFGTAIYTGLLAVPLGWCFLSTIGVWRFHSPTGRRATWR
jgi:cell shape-determining protein MreD